MKSRFLQDARKKRSNNSSVLKKSNGTCTVREEFRPGFRYVLNKQNMAFLEQYSKSLRAGQAPAANK